MSRKRITFGALAACLAFFLAGCAAPAKPDYSGLVWPLPPDEPRIKFVQVIAGPEDLGLGQSSLGTAIFGEERQFSFKKPFGVVSDGEGRIFVSDIGRIIVFDQAQKKLYEFGGSGSSLLALPLGMTVSDDGTLYVADATLERVLAFDRKGRTVAIYGKRDDFDNPVSVAVDNSRQRLYVVDSKKHYIKAYSLGGESLFTVGGRGSDNGKFNYPLSAAVDREGNLYVGDMGNFRVQIFDSNGKFIRAFGQAGNTPGSFSRIKAVALDSEGHIYVSDSGSNAVQIFDNQGQLLLFFGGPGSNPGFYSLLQDISIDKNDRIYAIDQIINRIQVYQYLSERFKRSAEADRSATGK